MIVSMRPDASEEDAESIMALLRGDGYELHTIRDAGPVAIGVNGRPVGADLPSALCDMPGVSHVHQGKVPYKLASRAVRPGGTVVPLDRRHSADRHRSSLPDRAPWNRAIKCCERPSRFDDPVVSCFGAARSSLAHHHTASRDLARGAAKSWRRHVR